MEHLALNSPLPLGGFCDRMREILDLPEFCFDRENETEWGTTTADQVEYNVSRPYEVGTLQEWDHTVPAGCNIGISLTVCSDHPHTTDLAWVADHLVSPVAQKLANGLRIPIHYHRTWCSPGNNIPRNQIFNPSPA